MADLSREMIEKIDLHLGIDSSMAQRVKFLLENHSQEKIVAMNRKAFLVLDEAMVWAEMLSHDAVILEHVAFDRVAISAATGEFSVFNATESGREHLTNFTGPKTESNELHFFKAIAVQPESNYSQTDKEHLLRHMRMSILGPQNKPYIYRRPIDRLPAGAGLQGLLANGGTSPEDMNKFRRWVRFGPQEETRCKLEIPTSATGLSDTAKYVRVDMIGYKAIW